jgi:hypothetical protein
MVSPASATAIISYSASDGPTMPGLNVIAGQTCALIIDNYTQDLNGYTLSFSGNASFIDNSAPTFASITDNCYDNSVTITLSENVSCSSIAANGSDFQISGPGSPTITSAVGVGCPTSGFTNQVKVSYIATGSGTFTISSQIGSDGNAINNASFNATGIIDCNFNDLSFFTYTWSGTGAPSPSTYVNQTTSTLSGTATFSLVASVNGCSGTAASTTVSVSNPPSIISISPP